MAHIILTGATGLVGSAVLSQALKSSKVSQISILSRKPVPMAEKKQNVTVIEHKDFLSYSPELLERLKGAEGCIWALGVSATQVDKKEYEKITVDFPVAAAEAFATLSNRFKFVYVSGEGASTSPGITTQYFGKVKGQAETRLLELAKSTPSLEVYSMRPAFVDAHGDEDVQQAQKGREIPAWMRGIRVVIDAPLRTLFPSMVSPTPKLGEFMINLAAGDGQPLQGTDGKETEGEGRVISNKAFRRLMRL